VARHAKHLTPILDYNKAVSSLFRAKARLTFLSLLPPFLSAPHRPGQTQSFSCEDPHQVLNKLLLAQVLWPFIPLTNLANTATKPCKS
jgi:hypothetical protein